VEILKNGRLLALREMLRQPHGLMKWKTADQLSSYNLRGSDIPSLAALYDAKEDELAQEAGNQIAKANFSRTHLETIF